MAVFTPRPHHILATTHAVLTTRSPAVCGVGQLYSHPEPPEAMLKHDFRCARGGGRAPAAAEVTPEGLRGDGPSTSRRVARVAYVRRTHTQHTHIHHLCSPASLACPRQVHGAGHLLCTINHNKLQEFFPLFVPPRALRYMVQVISSAIANPPPPGGKAWCVALLGTGWCAAVCCTGDGCRREDTSHMA